MLNYQRVNHCKFHFSRCHHCPLVGSQESRFCSNAACVSLHSWHIGIEDPYGSGVSSVWWWLWFCEYPHNIWPTNNKKCQKYGTLVQYKKKWRRALGLGKASQQLQCRCHLAYLGIGAKGLNMSDIMWYIYIYIWLLVLATTSPQAPGWICMRFWILRSFMVLNHHTRKSGEVF